MATTVEQIANKHRETVAQLNRCQLPRDFAVPLIREIQSDIEMVEGPTEKMELIGLLGWNIYNFPHAQLIYLN